MIAGIIGVPKRAESIKNLSELIAPSVDRLEVFMDENYRGMTWNSMRAHSTLLSQAKLDEPVLIMTDDVTTVPDWRERWEKIHAEANDRIYCLYAAKRHLFKPQNLARGWVKGHFRRCYYDPAVILVNQHDLVDRVEAWKLNWTPPSEWARKKSARWFDWRIQYYLEDRKIPFTITTPTLLDHLLIKSTLGHAWSEGSPHYVGSTS